MYFLIFQETKTPKKVSYTSGKGNSKRASYISGSGIFQPKLEKISCTWKRRPPINFWYFFKKKTIFIFREMKTPKEFFKFLKTETLKNFFYYRKQLSELLKCFLYFRKWNFLVPNLKVFLYFRRTFQILKKIK